MRLVIQEFLALLKERAELDRLLPDLLVAMGYEVIKRAHQGEVEHGVDVAAVKRDDGPPKLYIFQVKKGDIGPREWDVGHNSVRASLNAISDVRFKDCGVPDAADAERVVVVVHNGELRGNVKENWKGFEDDYKYKLERWDLGTLTDLIERHMLSEYLFPDAFRHLMRKGLAFLDVPGYDFHHFTALLDRYFAPEAGALTDKAIGEKLTTLRLVMAVAHKYALEAEDLAPSLFVSERCVLRSWGWLLGHGRLDGAARRQFEEVLRLYLDHLMAYVQRIAPAMDVQNGLAFNDAADVVEYPLRAMEVVGTLGLAASFVRQYGSAELTEAVGDALEGCVRQNHSACANPLLDRHQIPMFLGVWGLLATGRAETALWWINEAVARLALRKRRGKPLPEAFNNIEAVIEYEATGERPPHFHDESSTLIYFLCELLAIFQADDAYVRFKGAFEEVNLQVWYPPSDVEAHLFINEVDSGVSEVSITLPETLDELRADILARAEHQPPIELTTAQRGLPYLVLLACKHYGTPIFPQVWRELLAHTEEAGAPHDAHARMDGTTSALD